MSDDKFDEGEVRAYELERWLRRMSIGELAVIRKHWSYDHSVLKEDDPEKGVDKCYSLSLIKLVDKKIRHGYFGGLYFPIERFKFKYIKSKHVFWTEGVFSNDECGYIEPLEFTNWTEPKLDLKNLQIMHFRNI